MGTTFHVGVETQAGPHGQTATVIVRHPGRVARVFCRLLDAMHPSDVWRAGVIMALQVARKLHVDAPDILVGGKGLIKECEMQWGAGTGTTQQNVKNALQHLWLRATPPPLRHDPDRDIVRRIAAASVATSVAGRRAGTTLEVCLPNDEIQAIGRKWTKHRPSSMAIRRLAPPNDALSRLDCRCHAWLLGDDLIEEVSVAREVLMGCDETAPCPDAHAYAWVCRGLFPRAAVLKAMDENRRDMEMNQSRMNADAAHTINDVPAVAPDALPYGIADADEGSPAA